MPTIRPFGTGVLWKGKLGSSCPLPERLTHIAPHVILLPRRGYCVGGFKNQCSSVRFVSFRVSRNRPIAGIGTENVYTCEGMQKLTPPGPGGKMRVFRWVLNYAR